MTVLGQYHAALGELVHRFEGTIEHFAGDGLMVFFNDPLPCPDAPARAVRMAVAMRERVTQLAKTWQHMGHQLQFGAGIAQGHATLGRVGFEGRYDYAAIGTVTNLAARLCDTAAAGQILVSQRVQHAAEGIAVTDPLGELALRGFSRPARVFNVVTLEQREPAERKATLWMLRMRGRPRVSHDWTKRSSGLLCAGRDAPAMRAKNWESPA